MGEGEGSAQRESGALTRDMAEAQIVTPPESGSGLPQPPLVQPPTLQDPASGAVQQAYGLFSRYAGQ